MVIVTPINVVTPPMIATILGTSPSIKYAKISETAGVKYRAIVASETPTLFIVYAKAIYGITVGNAPRYKTDKIDITLAFCNSVNASGKNITVNNVPAIIV